MNATSVVAGVEEIRNAVCPRTSYATAGEAAYSLYLVSEGSTELSKKLEDAFKQGKEFNRVDALDRNEFVTKCTSGQIAGHVLVFVCPKDISPQSITNLVTTRKTNLVFALHDSTGDVSKLQQVYREQCAGDATVAFDTWSHCHVMYCYRRGAYTNTTAREFGYSKQPSVQSRNQFRFLWSTPEGSDGKLRVLQRLSDKASSRSGTKLSVDTWDQRVTDILRKKGGDFDVYSMVRQECVGSSLEADLVIKRLDGAGVEKDASNGDQGKVVSAEEDGEDGRANFMVKMTLQCLPQGMKGRIRNVLDYGCAEGAITAALCKELQLPPERGFGADVRAIPSPGFTFVQLPSEGDVPGQVGSILPTLPNGSMDLVCSAMVFHHVRHVEVMFRELRRVISPNGCLIIREHNCQGKSDAAFLDVTHGLFSLAWSDPVEWPAFIEEYEAWYRSREEWNALVEAAGFRRYSEGTSEAEGLYEAATRSYYNQRKGRFSNVIKAYYATYVPIDIPQPMPDPTIRKRPRESSEAVASSSRSLAEPAKRPSPQSNPQTHEGSNAHTIFESSKYKGTFYIMDANQKAMWLSKVDIADDTESGKGSFTHPKTGQRCVIRDVRYASK